MVLTGDGERAATVANAFWEISFEPQYKPVLWPAPVFTAIPGWDAPTSHTSAEALSAAADAEFDRQASRSRLVDELRTHHDQVIVPALDMGQPVVCLGAWWRLPAITELSGGMPITLLGEVWPSAPDCLVLDYAAGPVVSTNRDLPADAFAVPGLVRIPAADPGGLIAHSACALRRLNVTRGL